MPAETDFLVAFSLTYAAILIVPGPNLAVVAQACLWLPGRKAAATILGIALGGAVLATGAGLGATSIEAFGTARTLAHLVFVAMLIAVGCKALARVLERRPTAAAEDARYPHAGLAWGFFTAVTNPISAAFFLSAALTFGQAATPRAAAGMGLAVFVLALGWFGLVGAMLSSRVSRRVYVTHWRPIDACAGLALITAAALTCFHLFGA